MTAILLTLCLGCTLAEPVSSRAPSAKQRPTAGTAVTAPRVGETFEAQVVGVGDGDTIRVLRAATGSPELKVRLFGVDCPELGQPFGTAAKKLTSELVFNRKVRVRVHDVDRFGRLVADVDFAENRSLNRELVGQGLAWWFRRFAPADTELERLESAARKGRIGLWKDENPVAPWLWRG